jgi:hypothetical protein
MMQGFYLELMIQLKSVTSLSLCAGTPTEAKAGLNKPTKPYRYDLVMLIVPSLFKEGGD